MTIVTGKVVRGKQEGTKLGFPTANIHFNGSLEPGIYTGYASIENKDALESIIYIADSILECHILDFTKKDLYDQEISVEVLDKIRGVREFSGLDEAREQIKEDVQKARVWFRNRKN